MIPIGQPVDRYGGGEGEIGQLGARAKGVALPLQQQGRRRDLLEHLTPPAVGAGRGVERIPENEQSCSIHLVAPVVIELGRHPPPHGLARQEQAGMGKRAQHLAPVGEQHGLPVRRPALAILGPLAHVGEVEAHHLDIRPRQQPRQLGEKGMIHAGTRTVGQQNANGGVARPLSCHIHPLNHRRDGPGDEPPPAPPAPASSRGRPLSCPDRTAAPGTPGRRHSCSPAPARTGR